MTPTPVGMRCPECSKEKTEVRTLSSLVGGTERHDGADRDQRHRVPGKRPVRGRQRCAEHRDLQQGRPLRAADRSAARVLAAGDLRLPARRLPAHRVQHVPAVRARSDARTGPRQREVRCPVCGLAAGRLLRCPRGRTERVHRRCVRCGLRLDGRGVLRDAGARDRSVPVGDRRSDPVEPRIQLRPVEHLRRRAHRWSGGGLDRDIGDARGGQAPSDRCSATWPSR